MPQTRRPLALALALVLTSLAWAGAADAAPARQRRLQRHRHHPGAAAAAAAAATAAATNPVGEVAPLAAPRSPAGPSFGRVQFVTDRRAYLDRGRADGLAAKQTLAIARGGRAIGACMIEVAGDHEATCVGGRLRVGDTFRTPRAAGRRVAAPARVPEMAPLVDQATLQTRAATIADGTIDKVEFSGRRSFRSHTFVEVSPGFGAWFTQADPRGGVYAQERIDGALRGIELGATGFRFDGAFSAIRWTTPVAVERFRSGTPTQFYLWEAEASRRVQEGGTTVAVGRLWPFHTPGLTLLDGIQLGRQSQDRSAEGGLYAGLIPTADSLTPTFDLFAAGLYGALTQVAPKKTSRLRLAREEARLGVWRGTTTGVVTEAEALAQAWLGPLVAGGGARVHWAPEVSTGGGAPAIEHAYVDLGVRPSIDSGAGLHLRYVGASLLPSAPLRAEVPLRAGALHAIADVHVDLSPRLALGGNAGAHRDGDTGRHQLHGGGEVRWPRLFGDTGGLWVGAEVERGWMQGENLYVQVVAHHEERLQFLARLSANGTRFETPTAISNLDELGGYLSVDGVLSSWLRLRAWSLLRLPVFIQGQRPVDASFGGVGGLSLAGSM